MNISWHLTIGLVMAAAPAGLAAPPQTARESSSEGPLTEVQSRMQASHRRLAEDDTGEQTQAEQRQIVEILGTMIKEAQRREKSSGSGQGQQAQAGGAQQSSDRQGPQGGKAGGGSKSADTAAERTVRTGPQSPWSKLRDKERDPVYSAIKEKFPARYQQLLEQYYKSFQVDRER